MDLHSQNEIQNIEIGFDPSGHTAQFAPSAAVVLVPIESGLSGEASSPLGFCDVERQLDLQRENMLN